MKFKNYRDGGKKIISGALLLLIVSTFTIFNLPVALAVGKTTFTIPQLTGKYKTQGRTLLANNELDLCHNMSSFEFNANCSGAVNITIRNKRCIESSDGGIYFAVEIDGVLSPKFLLSPRQGVQTLTIASNLAAGDHKFKFIRNTEYVLGEVAIQSITLNGTVLAPPADKDLYIEFLGDSITCGYATINNDMVNSNPGLPIFQCAVRSYAFMTASNLGANLSVMSSSGCNSNRMLSEIYPFTKPNQSPARYWNFEEERKPDIVVIALGENDKYVANANDRLQGFKNLLEFTRLKNPNAKIVWAYGMMGSTNKEQITGLLNSKGGESNDYYFVDLPANYDGRYSHPSAEGHVAAAVVLTQYLGTLINNDKYDIVYNNNGGTGMMDNQKVDRRSSFTLCKNTFTKEGYTFAGWAKTTDDNVEFLDESTVGSLSSVGNIVVNLYAKWIANQYEVTFDKAGGIGGSDNVIAIYDSEMPAASLPINPGYSFNGYFNAATGGNKYYDTDMSSSTLFNETKPITLFAQWERDIIIKDTNTNITLEDNDDVIPKDTQLVVKKVTTGESFHLISKALSGISDKFEAFNIKLKNGNNTIQPAGRVKLTMQIPKSFDKNKVLVYYISDNGEAINLNYTNNNDETLSFFTNHFSNYVLAERSFLNSGDDNTNPGGGNTAPDGGNNTPGGGNTTPGGGNTTPGGGNTTPGGGNNTTGPEGMLPTGDSFPIEAVVISMLVAALLTVFFIKGTVLSSEI